MKIKKINSIEILDSRGTPTIMTSIELEDGTLEFGQVPMLQVEPHGKKGSSFQLVQSTCILHTMAQLAPHSVSSSLYPSDPIQAHKVDALLDFEADTFTGLCVCQDQS